MTQQCADQPSASVVRLVIAACSFHGFLVVTPQAYGDPIWRWALCRASDGFPFGVASISGIWAATGRRARWRRLFRADRLHGLTQADTKVVAALDLVTVIDLRTPEEVAAQGRARVPGTVHQLPLADVLPHGPGTAGWSVEAASIAEAYLDALEAGCETVREVLAILTDPSSYPAVVFCPSGVDRTGIVSAVVLGLLGVPDGVIVTDYAASREAVLRRVGRLRFEHPPAVEADLDRYEPGMLGVVPEGVARFVDRVRAEHGSFAG